MAFYQDQGKKSREQKRRSAEMRGGLEDEGARYSSLPARGSHGRRDGENRPPYSGKRSASADNPRAQQPHSISVGRTGTPQNHQPFHSRKEASRPSRDYGKNAAPYPVSNQKQDNRYRSSDSSARPSRPYMKKRQMQPPRPYQENHKPQRNFSPHPTKQREAEAFRYHAPQAIPVPPADESLPPENLLSGRNPIREALKSGRDIEKLLVARGELSGSAREIVQTAKDRHIPVQEVDRSRLDAITPHHQGMLAFASAYQYHSVDDMLALAKEREEAPLLILLDGITDPHNLGAIIRTAECAGAHGVIVQERRAVGLTPAAVKASAGAVEYVPVARVTNLTQTVQDLQKKGLWVFAADMEGENYSSVDFSGPLALIIGAEGEGVSRRVLDTCDRRVALPIRGQLSSLNASVAAGILLYATLRAR